MNDNRSLVFISHSNPEDNTFTLWLASRLTSLGYLVWSDVTQLFGAEYFWDEIEDAIRNHAIKVVVVLSNHAIKKPGVKDELAVAVSVERSLEIDQFVVPVRIDDLPFDEVPPNLIRKNIIDFHGSWADGLQKLIKVLKRDNVPKVQEKSAYEIGKWINDLMSGEETIIHQEELLSSNWLEFERLPQSLNFYNVPFKGNELKKGMEQFTYPYFPYNNMVATFAEKNDIDEYMPSWKYSTKSMNIPFDSIINNDQEHMRGVSWQDLHRMLTYLIRDAWDKTIHSKSLLQYPMASKYNAWYFPINYIENNKVHFDDMDGSSRYKSLLGYSKKRNVYWHFAIEAAPRIGKNPILVAKPHVAFTTDGVQLIPSDQQLHTLRRGFCKNWWNDRWRGLLYAYLSQICDESGFIELHLGSNQLIRIKPTPVLFQSPISVKGDTGMPALEDESDESLDQLADQTEWDINVEDEYVNDTEGSEDEDIECVEEDS